MIRKSFIIWAPLTSPAACSASYTSATLNYFFHLSNVTLLSASVHEIHFVMLFSPPGISLPLSAYQLLIFQVSHVLY